jgi:hypothetical protein
MNPDEALSTKQARHRGRARHFRALALAVIVSAGIVPLALPDRDGVTRASAREHSELPAWATRELDRANVDPAQALVSLTSGQGGIPVPRSYLGISTEYWTLPYYASHLDTLERVFAQVHVPGDGALILRIGGDSADHSFWDLPVHAAAPSWIFRVTPDWLNEIRTIVNRGGVRLILDLNLVTDSRGAAIRWARAAKAGLPRTAIAGLEIGNEPDIYNRWYWLSMLAERFGRGLLPAQISALTYTHDFGVYARALARATPGLPLIGPALSNPVLNIGWFRSLIAHERSRLLMVSAHQYPFSRCVARRSRAYPSISRILSERASAGIAHRLAPVIRLAHRAGLPFRLTELNSVTCGGVSGVSNTFATALWAPDALFELLHAGVDGVHVHVREHPINGAYAFDARGLVARPLLYGMILFARALGQDAHLLAVHLQRSASLGLKVWAVRVRGGVLHILLIDKGHRPVRVLLALPARAPATVERLLAPSVAARGNVVLGGQWLGRQGQWLGTRSTETITRGRRGYVLMLPSGSAALVRVRLGAHRYRHSSAAQPTRARPAHRSRAARHLTRRAHR